MSAYQPYPQLIEPRRPVSAGIVVLRVVAVISTLITSCVSGYFSLVMAGFAVMCTDDFDDSDCPDFVAFRNLAVGIYLVIIATAVIACFIRNEVVSGVLAGLAIFAGLASILVVPILIGTT